MSGQLAEIQTERLRRAAGRTAPAAGEQACFYCLRARKRPSHGALRRYPAAMTGPSFLRACLSFDYGLTIPAPSGSAIMSGHKIFLSGESFKSPGYNTGQQPQIRLFGSGKRRIERGEGPADQAIVSVCTLRRRRNNEVSAPIPETNIQALAGSGTGAGAIFNTPE